MRRVFLLALFVVAGCRTTVPAPPAPPTEMGTARARWLFDQRAYPFGDIPVDARRSAFEQVARLRSANQASETLAPSLALRSIGPLPVVTRWPWRNATGRVKALAISPLDSQIVLAGASSGGIWRSSDGGRSFTPVSDNHVDLSVGAIAFAPSDPKIVYAAMGSDFLGTGLLRSADAGQTWQRVSGPSFAPRGTAIRIVIDPFNPNRLWVAQTSQQDETSGKVYSSDLLRSEDGGVTWKRLFPAIITDFIATPGSASTTFLGVSRHDGDGAVGVYRSVDGGDTWSLVYSGTTDNRSFPKYKVAISESSPQRNYLYASFTLPTPTVRLLVSEDGGSSWSERPPPPPARGTPTFLHVDPANSAVLYLGFSSGDAHKSNDGGATWTNITKSINAEEKFDPANSTTHIDQHALAFEPGNSQILYLANDGGVYKSIDGGTSFTSLADTLSIVQAYRIAAHPTDASLMFLATQDNGLERRNPDGTWLELVTGDYGSVLFNTNDPGTFATNYVFGTIFLFAANGDRKTKTLATDVTFGEVTGQSRIGFIAPFEHSRRTNTLYFGTWRLFLSHDFGETWSAPAGTLDLTKGEPDTVSAIGISSADPNLIYTGSSRGRLMLSRDSGLSFTDVTKDLPNRWIRAIVVDREQPNVAYVAYSGYRTPHVFRTADYGASWQPFVPNLPDIPVNALLIDPSDRNILYAGTDVGIFRFDATRGNWEFFGTGMPPVVVTSFDVTAAGRIIASTYGRGAYELPPPSTTRRRSVRP